MSLLNSKKLKQLYQQLPQGVVVSSSWLQSQGISMQLRYKYVLNGWLEKIGRQAYIINKKILSWDGMVVGIQSFMGLSYHIGGLKALELQGYAHYLPLGDEDKIVLYGKSDFPSWLQNIEFEKKLVLYKKPYFDDYALKDFPSSIKGFDIKVSSVERAIFELLYLIEKDGISFEFVSEIFEGLTTLRPDILDQLLKRCKSKKVKRVFLFFADYYKHSWNEFIDKDIDIGSSRMQVVKDGKLDKKYLITVPKSFV